MPGLVDCLAVELSLLLFEALVVFVFFANRCGCLRCNIKRLRSTRSVSAVCSASRGSELWKGCVRNVACPQSRWSNRTQERYPCTHTRALSMHAHTRALQMHAHTSTTWYMSRRIYSSVNKLRKTPSVNKITPALVSCRCTQAQCVGTPTCQKIRGRALVLVNKSSNRTGSGEAARARRRVRRGCTCVYLK